MTALINGYQQELLKLQEKDNILKNQQKNKLQDEMETFKSQCDMGFRDGVLKEAVEDVPTNTFLNFATSIANDYPLINDILETLIGSTKDTDVNKIKTHEVKT